MSVLKHLKTLQHVSIIILIIFRELVGSLLKSLNLKVFKNVKVNCGDVAASPQLTFTLHYITLLPHFPKTKRYS